MNVLSLEAATAEAALRTAEAEVDFLTDTRQVGTALTHTETQTGIHTHRAQLIF